MERERISIRHYGRRVSLCLPPQTGIEKGERGRGMAERESQIEIVNINFDGTREQRWFEGTGVRMENNDSMPDICRRGRVIK